MEKIYTTNFPSITLLLLMLSTLQFSLCSNVTFFCTKEERDALINFKQSIRFPSTFNRSWTGDNCCKWKGVTCDGVNSHVVKLAITPELFPSWEVRAIEFSRSLLKLRYLNHLDLSGVYFKINTIPKLVGEMKQLKYLRFVIDPPYPNNICVVHHLGNLTNLEGLDISLNHCSLLDVEWISHLRAIKLLNLAGVDLAKSHGLMKSLSTLPLLSFLDLSFCRLKQHLYAYSNFNSTNFLPKLQHLYLSGNYIEGPVPIAFQNMTLLKHLDLSYNHFHGMVPTWFGKFRDLTHLDLSENDFQGIEDPVSVAFHNMTSLNVFDLSKNNFHGMVPRWFGKFRDLTDLHLQGNDFQGIEGGIFSLLKNLSNLKTLDFSHNQLQRDRMFSNDGESPLNECNLEVLDLSHSNLIGSIPMTLGSFSNLTTLDLSHNNLNGSIPDSLGKLSLLLTLSLDGNKLSGTIPELLGNLCALKYLYLSDNSLNGTIPKTLSRLSNLVSLDLSNNNLEGVVSEIHFLNISSLRDLDLSNNQLTIRVDHQWVPPFQLHNIVLSSCNVGTIGFPRWIQTQNETEFLILSNAQISGTIPDWLSYVNVSMLDLSSNQLTGFVPRFSPSLWTLDLSNNFLSGSLHEDIGYMLPLLGNLHLNGNHISGTIPSSLCSIEYLTELDLGKNKLSGSMPDCWLPNHLSLINFSYNNLSGMLPSSIEFLVELISLHLNDNHFHGEIPKSLAKCEKLVILDLGGNNLSGSIPPWNGLQLRQIQILRLRKNNFNGTIPLQLCSMFKLRVLDLAANNLRGTIPRCLASLSGMKIMSSSPHVALAPQSYSDGSPSPMDVNLAPQSYSDGSLSPTDVDLSPHNYSFSGVAFAPSPGEANWHQENVVEVLKGKEIEYTTVLQFVIDLDLSNNYLVGSIPEELMQLSGLIGLNLSYNHFSGNIPEKIGNMKSLESLDLSNNRISGKIPENITNLSSLSHLNLSNNNLSGQIPMGNQLQTINNQSVYAGNPLLCGNPLPNKCPTTQREETPIVDGNSGNDVTKELLFWIVVMLGYAIGFWGVIGVLVFKKRWRLLYFKFADEVKDKVYVVIAVKVLQLDRKLRNRI